MTDLRLLLRPLLVAGVAVVLNGCAAAPADDAPPVATDTVNLPPSYRFEPAAITVAAGTTVTWTNSDNFTHNVQVEGGGEPLNMRPGESVTHTFTAPGEYAYVCTLHPNDMQGTVLVSD